MIRALCLGAGLVGGVTLSQFPEFSQQYLQRLGGQVDELTLFVKDFDTSALANGLGREEALAQMVDSPFILDRQADMRRTFARHARLSENLLVLQAASPMARLRLPHRMADADTLAAVWADYRPAVPVSGAGAAATGAGFLGGWAIMLMMLGLFATPLRMIRQKPASAPKRQQPGAKVEPALARPTLVAETPSHIPRLAGAVR